MANRAYSTKICWLRRIIRLDSKVSSDCVKGLDFLKFQRIQRGLRRRIATLIAPKDLPSLSLTRAFYPQQPTCQIPNLYYLFSKFLGNRENGFYVEVGAYDGLFVSNTWGLAQRGWHGLLIEPVPNLASKCRENYAHLEKIEVLEVAIANTQQDLTLYVAGTLSTANSDAFDEYANVAWARNALTNKSITVACHPLEEVLRRQRIPYGFDLLVVDVEGFEAEVFESFELDAWNPKMLIVELADTHPDLSATQDTDAHLARTICEAGYVIGFKDLINTSS